MSAARVGIKAISQTKENRNPAIRQRFLLLMKSNDYLARTAWQNPSEKHSRENFMNHRGSYAARLHRSIYHVIKAKRREKKFAHVFTSLSVHLVHETLSHLHNQFLLSSFSVERVVIFTVALYTYHRDREWQFVSSS